MNTIEINLSPQELETVSNALAERPYKEVAGIMSKLKMQMAAQAKAFIEKQFNQTSEESHGPANDKTGQTNRKKNSTPSQDKK